MVRIELTIEKCGNRQSYWELLRIMGKEKLNYTMSLTGDGLRTNLTLLYKKLDTNNLAKVLKEELKKQKAKVSIEKRTTNYKLEYECIVIKVPKQK